MSRIVLRISSELSKMTIQQAVKDIAATYPKLVIVIRTTEKEVIILHNQLLTDCELSFELGICFHRAVLAQNDSITS